MLKNKLPFVIFALMAICLSIWMFFIFKERNSLPVDNAEKIEKSQTQIQEQVREKPADGQTEESEAVTDSLSSDDFSSEDSAEDLPDNEDTTIEKTNLLEISQSDCDNECKDYDDSEEFKYCQEVCGLGLKDKNKENSDNCNNLSGLKKDYCLKDLAISKSDLEMCTKIEDLGILKICRNRITENLLDSK